MKILIIDLETTGLDPGTHQIIEVGAILYSVDYQCILQQISTLLPCDENLGREINKIEANATKEVVEKPAIDWLKYLIKESDYLVAHNAEFDKQWLTELTNDKKWLCTFDDFVWPENHKQTNLIDTALNHHVAITQAHRALADCQLIAQLFDRAKDLKGLIEKAIARSLDKKVKVFAVVSYDQKDLAKEKLFRWDGTNKKWHKIMKESDFLKEKDSYVFDFNWAYIE